MAANTTTTDKYMARGLMLSFFLPMKWQMYVVVAICLYFVYQSVRNKNEVPRNNYMWALALGGGFFLYLLALPFTPPDLRKTLLHICERKIAFLVLPFVFAVLSQAYRDVIRKELMWFIYGAIACCVLANAAFAYHWYANDSTPGAGALSHVDYRIYFESVTQIHPTYMGMYLCFGICILLLNDGGNKWPKYLLGAALMIFGLALLAKSPIIALVLVAGHYLYTQRKQLYKYGAVLAGVPVLVAVVYFTVPFFKQRVNELLPLVGIGKQANVVESSVSARKLIWQVDTSLLQQPWLTGVGPGQLMRLLHERYFFYSLSHGYFTGYYDPHNQYFWEWLSFGIVGILFILGLFYVHFRRAIKFRDNLYAYLLVIICITCLTETVLGRQTGVFFYSFFTSLFFFGTNARDEHQA